MAKVKKRTPPRNKEKDTSSDKRTREDNSDEEDRPGHWGRLKEETRHSIIGIFLAITVLLLSLAPFGKGGFVGGKLYFGLHFLFGSGYGLLPTLLALLSWNFLRARKEDFTTPALIAGPFFLISGLGLLSILQINESLTGGWIGENIIERPLVWLFDTTVAGVVLGAILLTSILVIFDTPLRLNFLSPLARLFGKKPEETEDEDAEVHLDSYELPTPDPIEPDTQEDETVPKPSIVKKLPPEKPSIEVARAEPPLIPAHHAFTPPPITLLSSDKGKSTGGDPKVILMTIKRTLKEFDIDVEMDNVSVGPSITRFALKPASNVRLVKILSLQRELELALAASPIRIEAPIPGKSLVGIEVPNNTKATVGLASLLKDPAWTNNPNPLFIPLGKDVSGNVSFMNIAKMPHILVAGTTGSGKSVTMHNIIISLLYRNAPDQLRFIMVDPKRVELTLYNGIPHLMTPVITEAKKTVLTLKWVVKEMERRLHVLEEHKVRDIGSYHQSVVSPALKKHQSNAEKMTQEEVFLASKKLPELMPYIVIVIDELSDLMSAFPRELEASIVRIAQMSRAAGIHLILSTQRPSVNVITGLIKANVPARIALQVASQIDSRTIIDKAGAESLLGAGDMIFQSSEGKPVRLQSAYITESEVKSVVRFLKTQYANEFIGGELNITGTETMIEGGVLPTEGPTAIPGMGMIPDDELEESGRSENDDEKYTVARDVVIKAQKASTSYLQRTMGLGYSRAARMIDTLEERGIIGPGDGAKARSVLYKPGDTLPPGA